MGGGTTLTAVFCCCFIGHLTLIAVAGSPEGQTPIDSLHRIFFLTLPSKIAKGCRRSLGNGLIDSIVSTWTKIKEWTIASADFLGQSLYLSLVLGGYICFILFGWPEFPLPGVWQGTPVFSALFSCTCLMSFVAVATSDAGVVTNDNVEKMCAAYEYDEELFQQKDCQTCQLQKPARSKHCGHCNQCIARFDHHCIWIGNCVGLGNHGQFLLFLVLHAVFLCYGAATVYQVLNGILVRDKIWEAPVYDRQTGGPIQVRWFHTVLYLAAYHSTLCGLFVLCVALGLMLIGFTCWHWMLLFWLKSTTNESVRVKRLCFSRMETTLDAKEKELMRATEQGETKAEAVKNEIANLKLTEEEERKCNVQNPYAAKENLSEVLLRITFPKIWIERQPGVLQLKAR